MCKFVTTLCVWHNKIACELAVLFCTPTIVSLVYYYSGGWDAVSGNLFVAYPLVVSSSLLYTSTMILSGKAGAVNKKVYAKYFNFVRDAEFVSSVIVILAALVLYRAGKGGIAVSHIHVIASFTVWIFIFLIISSTMLSLGAVMMAISNRRK